MVLAFVANRLITSRRRTEAALRASEAQLRSGWEHAATASALLDLQGQVMIMADVALPGVGGTDLIRQLRRMVPEARVLYASGFSALAFKSQGLIDETGGFLPKPFTSHQLLAAVQARLDDTSASGAALRQ